MFFTSQYYTKKQLIDERYAIVLYMISQLTDKQLIRKNLRYATYKAVLDDRQVFVKEGVGKKTTSMLWLEAMGLQNMFELDPVGNQYNVPSVIFVSNNTIITSWADGKEMSQDLSSSSIDGYLDFLISLYVFIDGKTTSSVGTTRWNQPKQKDSIYKIMDKFDELQIEQYIDKEILSSLVNYIKENIGSIETRFTHGDLQPGNILVDGEDLPTVIDCESCSWLWPRHYNLVNLLFNYSLKEKRKFNSQFLEAFQRYFEILRLSPQDHTLQINISAAMRCVGILREHIGGHANEGHNELPQEIREFVESVSSKILSNKLFVESL